MIIYIVALFILGLIFGSFAGAQVWRLRARQVVQDKAEGDEVDSKELRKLLPLTNKNKSDRSRCLECGHTLGVIDLFPLLSWLSTKGRCRYCGRRIGTFEPLVEIAMGAFFVLSYVFWPMPLDDILNISQFIIWLLVAVLLVILFVYDFKWFILPNIIVFPLIVMSFVYTVTLLLQSDSLIADIASTFGAVAILAGIYWFLWQISSGRWVGLGDVKLGIALGLLVGSWQLAFLTLFLANFIGTVLVLPAIITGRMNRTSQVPFGPLLIMGFVISLFFGMNIIDWYLSATMTLVL